MKLENKVSKCHQKRRTFFLVIVPEKPVFVSSPFRPVSYWSQLVYGRGRVETRFYLSGIGVASLQSRPRLVTNTRRFAPVVMAIERLWPSVTPSIAQLTRSPQGTW